MLNIFRRRIANNNWLFNGQYIDGKGLYLYLYNRVPCVAVIAGINVTEAYAYLMHRYAAEVKEALQHCEYNYEAAELQFNISFVVLGDKKIVEVGADYVLLMFGPGEYAWADEVLKALAQYRVEAYKPQPIGFGQSMN